MLTVGVAQVRHQQIARVRLHNRRDFAGQVAKMPARYIRTARSSKARQQLYDLQDLFVPNCFRIGVFFRVKIYFLEYNAGQNLVS